MGRPLRPVPFPAIVYVLSTGNNLSYTVAGGQANPARQAKILRDIDRNAVPITPELAGHFGLPLRDCYT